MASAVAKIPALTAKLESDGAKLNAAKIGITTNRHVHETLTFFLHARHSVVTAGPRQDFRQNDMDGVCPQCGQIFESILAGVKFLCRTLR
jgi:hypothetical protein